MSTDPGLEAAVLQAVASACPRETRDQVTSASSFASLGLDSLDRIALAVAVEDTTGMAITDEVLPGLRAVSDIITHLSRQGART